MAKSPKFASGAALPLTLSVLLGTTALCTSPALAQQCMAGTYSATGQEPCLDAPAGHYVDSPGAMAPTACAVGTLNTVPGMTVCFAASAGYYVGVTGATVAAAAPAGYFVPTAGASAPTPAPVGYYVDDVGRTYATPALPGTYVGVTGATVATDAPPGTYVPVSGAAAPTPASPGHYVPGSGFTTQINAPAGTYVSYSGATSATQTLPGFYAPVPGLTTPLAAPAGTYVPGYGFTHVQTVAPGFYTSGGSAFPAPCPPMESCVGGTAYAAPTEVSLGPSAPLFDPIITARPASVGGTSATPLALTRPTGQPVFEVRSAQITGADFSAFSLLGLTPGSLIVPGGHLDLSLLFSPTLGRTFYADLTLTVFDPLAQAAGDLSYIFQLEGLGQLLEEGVPEPSTAAMLLSAALGAGFLGYRRRRSAAQDASER